ncbi:hypothetical protein MYA98_21505 [Salmonella sp. WGH-01]|nr:hypothetical protein MYA98_21505 [Salmonella sp. WGH-01]
MNQVAVVIGGGQTTGHSFAVGLQKKDTAWRSLIFKAIKPRMSPRN